MITFLSKFIGCKLRKTYSISLFSLFLLSLSDILGKSITKNLNATAVAGEQDTQPYIINNPKTNNVRNERISLVYLFADI